MKYYEAYGTNFGGINSKIEYPFIQFKERSTWTLALAIVNVFITWFGVNWGAPKNEGIFNDTPSENKSLTRNPLSANIRSPLKP